MTNLLNMSTLDGLREVERRGGKPFVEALIVEYLAYVEFDLHAIEAARATGDLREVNKRVHAAAGAARAVGAQALVDCLENAHYRTASTSQFEGALVVVKQVRAAFETWWSRPSNES
jgi:HPt (histidine-containing phosphotransfer) domain-containing protein